MHVTGHGLMGISLRTTGGAIVVEPGKSDWVRIEFEQKHNKMRLVKKDDN